MSKKSEEILALYKSKVMPTYSPSVVIASGKGVTVRDVDGRTYYDFTSGIGVNSVGYSHPKVVKAIQDQAAALAKALKVRKFVLVSDVPGLLKNPEDPETLLSTLHLGDVETLKADGTISGGMLPKIESCCNAIKEGVKKVHLVDGRMAHSLLLEIFTREGVGTEITE